MKNSVVSFVVFLACLICSDSVSGQNNFGKSSPALKLAKAQKIISKVKTRLGGERYLNVKTSIGRGKFSLIKDGVNVSFQSFVDVIVSPDKERTDFTENGSKTVQVNTGDTGWIFQEHLESFRDQKPSGIRSFKNSLRSHYDYLLRRDWKDEAVLSYEGRRRASLGKRNDVLKLKFKDGFEVEYEFSDEGLPMKTVYNRSGTDNKPISEETRYAQFVDEQGVLTPLVVDRYTNGKHSFRVNYESMIYNKRIPNSIFVKPSNTKKLRKKLKL